MNFSKNDFIQLGERKFTIKDFLGAGGQGEVYLVSDGTNDYAFKYYINIPNSDFVYNLKNNIHKGAPSNNFLWPKELIEFSDGNIGYIMDLRPQNYKSFISYLTGKTKFKSKKILLNWCIELVKSFKQLHEKGFSYQDLNDGSFFLDPDTGSLLICDNDNVTADRRNLGVLGKMRYMAPEIVRGDIDPFTNDRHMPDTHSDRFSLAIILFLALCLGNPFEGECLKNYTIIDEKAEFEMFGSNPIYIYNRNITTNRPIRGYHTSVLKRYPLIPSYVKDAFHKTFVDGLIDRENGRTTEIEWLKILCRYRDELISCACGEEFIYGFNEQKQNIKCPYCNTPTRKFCYMKVGKSMVLLEPKKYLYQIHLNKYSSEYNTPVCEVIQNKNNPMIWGLKLNLEEDVLIKDKEGNERTIDKKGVIPIISGLKIKFNEATVAEIINEN